MARTPFAGLEALLPGESLSQDGYAFQAENPYLTDRLLKIGALLHRHDEAVPMANPVLAPSVSVPLVGGSLPAGTPIYITYTLLDGEGGETLPVDPVVITTEGGFDPPIVAPIAVLDVSAGALLADTWSYAVTVTDGAGGETIISPPAVVINPPGNPLAQAQISGLSAAVASANVAGAPGAGWRLWRQQGGGPWYLIATGPAATDVFTDDAVIGDCTIAPPTQMNTQGTNCVTVDVPKVGQPPTAVNYAIYGSFDGSFISPCRLGLYPVSDLGNVHTYPDLTSADGAPPSISSCIGGAEKIDPDTELLFGFKSPVNTKLALPAGVRGDARITLNDNHLWLVLGLTAVDHNDWTDITGLIANQGLTVTGTGVPHQVWTDQDHEDFTTGEGVIGDVTAIDTPTLAVAGNLLTTSDATQTDAIGPEGSVQGPHSLNQHLSHVSATVGSATAMTNGDPWPVGGDPIVRANADSIVNTWAAAGVVPDPAPNDGVVVDPDFVHPVWGDNIIGDVLTINVADPQHQGIFYWDGADWQPMFVSVEDGTGYSVSGVFHPIPRIWRAAPPAPHVYSYEWTEAGQYTDNIKFLVHVHGYKSMCVNIVADTGHSGAYANKAESFKFAGIGLVLGMTDADHGLMYYLTGNLAGWSHAPSDLLMDAAHHPPDALNQKKMDANGDFIGGPTSFGLGEPATGPPVALTLNPAFNAGNPRDVIFNLDGTSDFLFPTASDDFWLMVEREGVIAKATLWSQDPAIGAEPFFTCTYDLTGTPFEVAPLGYLGVVMPYLEPGAGIAQMTATELITTDQWTLKNITEIDLDPSAMFVTDETGGKVLVRGATGQSIFTPAAGDYSPVEANMGQAIEMTDAGAVNLHLALHATTPFPVGAEFDVVQAGAGAITVTHDVGVTVDSKGGLLSSSGQWAVLHFRQRAIDEWHVWGDLA